MISCDKTLFIFQPEMRPSIYLMKRNKCSKIRSPKGVVEHYFASLLTSVL